MKASTVYNSSPFVELGQLIRSAQSGFASGDRSPAGTVQLRMNNVTTDGLLDWSSHIRVPATDKQIQHYGLQPGDVLFNSTNSPELVGKTTVFPGFKEPVVFSNHFLRLRVDDERLDSRYLAHWITVQWQGRVFERLATQWVNQASVRREDLLGLQIPLPSLPEQQRIAGILSRADRLRRLRRYALEMSAGYLQSVFLEMFGDPATNPMGWGEEVIEELLCSDRAGIQTGPFGSALKRHEYSDDGIPVWGIDNVKPGQFVDAGCLFIPSEKYFQLERYRAHVGDVLVSRAGTTGRMCVANPSQPDSIIGTNLIRISLDETRICPEYFVAVFTYFPSRIGRIAMTGDENAYSFINPKILRTLSIPLAPRDRQREFERVVSQLRCLRAQQEEASRQAEHLFQTLLHEAFQQ